jgi:hypothetical protein
MSLEIAPPSFSNHSRYGTAGNTGTLIAEVEISKIRRSESIIDSELAGVYSIHAGRSAVE